MWEVLTLQKPWRGIGRQAMWSRVCRGDRPAVTAAAEAAAPAGYVALMRELWAHDPVERPPFVETLQRLGVLAKLAGRLDDQGAPPTLPVASDRREADVALMDDQREPTVTSRSRGSSGSLEGGHAEAAHRNRRKKRRPRRRPRLSP